MHAVIQFGDVDIDDIHRILKFGINTFSLWKTE
jgi:hypothetical protein